MKSTLKAKYPDLIRIFRLIAYEGELRVARYMGRLSVRQWHRLRSLRRNVHHKLNIASGCTRHPGWINIDASSGADVRMDLRRPIPLPDGCAALIFCEHFCDHLNFPDEIGRFLRECHRVLEQGGRARFVLHDATDLMRACVDGDLHYFEVAEVRRPTPMEAVNFLFRFEEGHQFLYDFETFERVLRQAGFGRIERCRYRSSTVESLVLDFEHPSREVMSMYVEAIK